MYNFKAAGDVSGGNSIQGTPEARAANFVPGSTHHHAKNILTR